MAQDLDENPAAAENAMEEPNVQLATPPSSPDPELLDINDDPEQPHRFRRVANIRGPDAVTPGLAERLFLTTAEEPASVAEEERDPSWRKEMLEEMSSIEDNNT
jgi:hypothetical protein